MIQRHIGDVLAVERGLIVHGCNAQGAMGRGIAGSIRSTYPEAYRVYRDAWAKGGLQLGEISLAQVGEHKYIINAVTQEFYGARKHLVYVDYAAVRSCFEKVNILARSHRLPVHFPLIGCGLANGDWQIVAGIIEETVPDPLEKHLWILP